MKLRLSTQSMLMLALLTVGGSFAFAQQASNHLDLTAEQATLKANLAEADGFHLQIAGPDDYYWAGNITDTRNIQFTPYDENGERYADGQYIMQVTPIFQLTPEEQTELRALQASSTPAAVRAYRAERGIPEVVEVQTIHFRVLDGQFVTGGEEPVQYPRDNSQWEYHKQQQQEYLGMFGSVRNSMTSVGRTPAISADRLEKDHSADAELTQVINMDLIVQGSFCVGIDCINAENFGFDTQRLKENNLRINFEDTSNSASFPSNDWRIIVNDSDNGGASYFAIQDAESGRIPFRVEAGGFDHTLYVDNSRRVGINTAAPLTTIHSVSGDTPTLRLEQDQSAGWAAQTWDVAGNETNFFVRDVTNGSQLPFKIRPGADHNALVIDSDNNIGLGILDAQYDLHIFGNANDRGDVYVQQGSIGINVAPSAAYALDVTGNTRLTGNPIITGTSTFRGDESHFLTTGATFYAANFQPFVKFDAANSRVGIGTAAPAHQLELSQDDAVKPNGGSWSGPSDRRLKTDIVDFTDGLSVLMDMRPVRYHYNGLLNLPTEQEFIGVIAQDMQAIAPYTVKPLNPDAEGGEDYLAYDGSAVTYILVNAIQEQQAIIDAQQAEIDALQAQVAEIDQLKVQMAQLTRMMAELNAEKAEATTPTRTTDRD